MKTETKQGFTLTEVIIAMGILGFGLLALMSVLSVALRYQRQSINSMNAARINDMVLERLVSKIQADTVPTFWGGLPHSYPTSAFETGIELVGRDEFNYAIYAVEIPGLGDGSLDPPNTLVRIDAYVWWAEKGQAGQKRVSSSRLLNRGEGQVPEDD